MGSDYSAEHNVLGDLVSAGLDHNDLVAGGGDGAVHLAGLFFLARRVDEILAVLEPEADACDGSVERNVGDGDGGGGADHSGDLGAAVVINAHNGAGDDNVVSEVGGEEGAHRPVDHTGGEDTALGGLALAPVEAAGNAADGVELLLKLNGEGEVVDAVLRPCGGADGDENGGLTVSHHDGGVSELGVLAYLKLEGTARELHLVLSVVRKFSVLDYHSFFSFSGASPFST